MIELAEHWMQDITPSAMLGSNSHKRDRAVDTPLTVVRPDGICLAHAEHLSSVRTERKVAGAMVLVMRSRGLLRRVDVGLGRDADEA